MDFFLQPLNLFLTVLAIGSGLALLWPLISQRGTSLISTTQTTQLINQRAQVIDVRDVEQYAAGHIQNAKSLPLSGLAEQIGLAKLKKDKPVILVCERGVSAAKAASILAKAEFTDVHVLEGGLKAWREAQLPLVK